MTTPALLTTAGVFALIIGLCIYGPMRAKAEPGRGRPDVQQVYVMYPDTWTGRLFGPSKTGISNNPERRRRSFQTGHYHEIVIYSTHTVRNASRTEAAAHRMMRKAHRRGEWYNLPPWMAATAVRIVSRQTRRGPWAGIMRALLRLKVRAR